MTSPRGHEWSGNAWEMESIEMESVDRSENRTVDSVGACMEDALRALAELCENAVEDAPRREGNRNGAGRPLKSRSPTAGLRSQAHTTYFQKDGADVLMRQTLSEFGQDSIHLRHDRTHDREKIEGQRSWKCQNETFISGWSDPREISLSRGNHLQSKDSDVLWRRKYPQMPPKWGFSKFTRNGMVCNSPL